MGNLGTPELNCMLNCHHFDILSGIIETNGKMYLAITDKTYTRSKASQRCKDIYMKGGDLRLVVFENVQELTNMKDQLKQEFGKPDITMVLVLMRYSDQYSD